MALAYLRILFFLVDGFVFEMLKGVRYVASIAAEVFIAACTANQLLRRDFDIFSSAFHERPLHGSLC